MDETKRVMFVFPKTGDSGKLQKELRAMFPDADMRVMNVPDENDTMNDHYWTHNQDVKTKALQARILERFPNAVFGNEDSLALVIIRSERKRKEVAKELAALTGVNVYYSSRIARWHSETKRDHTLFLEWDYNNSGNMPEYCREYANIYARPEIS